MGDELPLSCRLVQLCLDLLDLDCVVNGDSKPDGCRRDGDDLALLPGRLEGGGVG